MRHDRPAAGHGFENDEPEGFVRAGVNEGVRRGEVARPASRLSRQYGMRVTLPFAAASSPPINSR